MWEKQRSNSRRELIVWRLGVWKAEVMPCDGASFFDNKWCSSRDFLWQLVFWSCNARHQSQKMAKKYGDLPYSIWPPTDAALLLPFRLSAHQLKRILFWCWFYSSVLTFLFIFFICFSIPKKQTESAYLKKKRKSFFFPFTLSWSNTRENPQTVCWF